MACSMKCDSSTEQMFGVESSPITGEQGFGITVYLFNGELMVLTFSFFFIVRGKYIKRG